MAESASSLTSIIVPCYNEAARLPLGAFEHFLSECGRSIRFLFVDDGSRDGTGALLEGFAVAHSDQVHLLRLDHNRGKAEAVRSGICLALSQWEPKFVGFWDADLATPLSSILSFVRLLESAEIDIVFGSRVKLCGRHIERLPARHYLGRVFATVVSIMLGLEIYDTQCGAKLFRANDEVRDVFAKPFLSKWVFDVEILARLLQTNSTAELERKLYEYPLESWRDVAGSKVKPMDFVAAIVEVLTIRRHYGRALNRGSKA